MCRTIQTKLLISVPPIYSSSSPPCSLQCPNYVAVFRHSPPKFYYMDISPHRKLINAAMESWRPTKRHLQDSYQQMNKNSLIITLPLSAPGSLCLSLPTSQEALQFTSECNIGLLNAPARNCNQRYCQTSEDYIELNCSTLHLPTHSSSSPPCSIQCPNCCKAASYKFALFDITIIQKPSCRYLLNINHQLKP